MPSRSPASRPPSPLAGRHIEVSHCQVCRSAARRGMFEDPPYAVQRCLACGFVYVTPRLSDDDLPQHRFRDYPVAYGERQSLFFLFTITRSDNRLPLEAWLDDEKVLALEPHHTPQEIGHFLEQVMDYHALAYGYAVGERQRQVRRGAAEHLAQGMRNDRLNIRAVVRLAVELYDLLYLHPEYEVASLLDELRSQMK